MKFESPENLNATESDTRTPEIERENKDELENEYDQEASAGEIENFQKEIEEKVGAKAKELEISKEKLIDLAGLDLESLEAEKLKELNLRQGELNFIRSDMDDSINEFNKKNIDEAIDEFEKNKKKGEELGDERLQDQKPLEASKINKFLEFVGEHKKVISVGELALYLSSYGAPALNFLVNSDCEAEIDGEKISLRDLADNQELVKNIDKLHNSNAPIDIFREYFNEQYISENFSMNLEIESSEEGKGKILFDFMGRWGNLEEDLKVFKSTDYSGNEIDYDTFQNNKEKIAEIISENTGAPKEEIEKYFNEKMEINTSKISIVEFEDFEINKNLKFQKSEVLEKYEKMSEKYNLNIPEEKTRMIEEFEKFGEEKGYENVWEELTKENMKNSVSSLSEKIAGETVTKRFYSNQEIDVELLAEGREQFGNLLIEKIEEAGYKMSELKEIGEEDPKKIITILAEVISKNIEYDYEKYELIQEEKYDEIKQQNYYLTLRDGKGVCEDYSELFAAAKSELEKQRVPNLDKFVVLETTPSQDIQNHTWNNIVTVDENGNIVMTSIDITWADHENPPSVSERLNAVDESHFYSSAIGKADEAHQKALEKIRDWNNLVKQKELEKILTQYDLRSHKRDQKLEGNKKLREVNKDAEILREEREKDVKWSLKKIREKIGKL